MYCDCPAPDDESIGCGGSIVKHIRKDSRVKVIFLTSGDKGDFKAVFGNEYQALRQKSAVEALNSLGVKDKFMGIYDIFVATLNADLSELLASTYFGAESYDYATAVATDMNGSVFVVGHTISKNFPATQNAYSKTFNGGTSDGIITKFGGALSYDR